MNPVLEELQKHTQILRLLVEKLSKEEKKQEYLTTSDAAKLLNRSRPTIRRWISEKKIEGVKVNKGSKQDRYLICRKSIDDLINRGHLL